MINYFCIIFLLVVTSLVRTDEINCSQQRDTFFQCMRNLHTSNDAKMLKDKNQVVAQQCGISQTSVQCWRKKDTCQNEAEHTAELSEIKKESLLKDNACWRNLQYDSVEASPPMPGFPSPVPGAPAPDPMTPAECIPPYDPQIAACTINLLQQDQQFISANAKMRQKAKQCQDQWPDDCKPKDARLVECLHKAYDKLTNLTVTNYRQCMDKAGYQLPVVPSLNSGRKQIFPLSDNEDNS